MARRISKAQKKVWADRAAVLQAKMAADPAFAAEREAAQLADMKRSISFRPEATPLMQEEAAQQAEDLGYQREAARIRGEDNNTAPHSPVPPMHTPPKP